MLDFMSFVQSAFLRTTLWPLDNSYQSLTSTPSALLDFPLPSGIHLHVSSLSAPNFATSYTLGSQGVVDGSLSFLYSSRGLRVASASREVYLSNLVRGYRHLQELRAPEPIEAFRKRIKEGASKDALLYGRLYLPSSTLEALYIRRLSPTRLLRLNCVSSSNLPNGGTLLALFSTDNGKYSTEYLYSTDSSLLGIRGLYNFGFDPRYPSSSQSIGGRTASHPWDHQSGRLSAGAEAYFSPVNKSGGISTGLRFTTLPIHTGFPYTMALTVNPLMGNLSSTYAVKAGPNLALCSRFDFNVYSYESDVVVGMELYQRKQTSGDVQWAVEKLRHGWKRSEDDVTGVLKARMDNHGKVGLLWECRIKELLCSFGAGLDFRGKDLLLGRVGVEVRYSS
jgi:distribution and morphology protein 10